MSFPLFWVQTKAIDILGESKTSVYKRNLWKLSCPVEIFLREADKYKAGQE